MYQPNLTQQFNPLLDHGLISCRGLRIENKELHLLFRTLRWIDRASGGLKGILIRYELTFCRLALPQRRLNALLLHIKLSLQIV